MANYIASGIGGLNNSGVYPNSRPQVDLSGLVDSATRAWQANRQGVLTRAIMQHQVAQQDAEFQMRQQAQELQMRQAGWRPADEVQPQPSPASITPPTAPGPVSSAFVRPPLPPAVDSSLSGEPASQAAVVSPPPPAATVPSAPQQLQPPSTSGPAQSMRMNGKTYVLGTPPALQHQMDARRQALASANVSHPGLFTPEEIEVGAHDDKAFDQLFARKDKADQAATDYTARFNTLNGAVDLKGKPLSESMKQMLAHNPTAYSKYSDLILNPPKDPVEVHKAERMFDNANQPSQRVVMEGPDGKRYIGIFDPTSQTVHSTGVEAPEPSGGKGGAGQSAADKKAATYVDLMRGAIPTMEALGGKVRPDRITAAIIHPNAGNLGLNQDEQDYLVAARSFLAGALHQESGARLSHEQLQFGMLRYFPNIGDSPQTLQNKLAAARQTIEDRDGELHAGSASGRAGHGGNASGGIFGDLIPKR